MLRVEKRGVLRTFVHIVIAFSVFLSAAFSMRRTTQIGTHCPTAVVQKVVETVSVKTACGCVVEKKVVRAPKLGEKTFKQCECAEKKSGKHQTQDQSGELITWFFSRPSLPLLPEIQIPQVSVRFSEAVQIHESIPNTPPPLSV